MTLESLESSAVLRFKNGNTYVGQVAAGKLHGKGRLEFADGIVYEGEFKNNRIEGEGFITWTDDSTYKGSFKNGVRNGYGEYENPIKEVSYKGEWYDGMRDGKGILKLADGSHYEGEFKNGLKQGKGKLVYPSGNTYDGGWRFNKKNGFGVMNWFNLNQKYAGEWRDDLPNGVGNLIWLDEKGINKILRNRYNGEFTRGERNGLGIFYYANGATYEGEWFKNSKQGYAVFVNENGQALYGFYKKDRLVRRIYVFNTLLQTLVKKNMKDGVGGFRDTSRDDNMIGDAFNQEMDEEDHISIREDKIAQSKILTSQSKSKNSSLLSGFRIPDKNSVSGVSDIKTIETGREEVSVQEPSIENPLITLRNNVYMRIVKVSDFINDEGREQIKFKLCEVLLRHHSKIKDWYRIYSEKNSKDYEEGFFVTISGFWQLLIDTRLINGRLNYVSFCRIISRYAMRDFEIYYDEKRVKSQIELMKKYDFEKKRKFEKRDKDSFFMDSDDGGTSQIENDEKIKTVLIDNYYEKKNQSENIVKHDKVLLQRFFINALIRVIYLKTGSIHSLPEQINKIFKTRIHPIISGKVRPKLIVNENASILARTGEIMKRYEGYLQEIFSVNRKICCTLKKGEIMDLKSFIDILLMSNIIKYQSLEDKKNFWMILENKHDPYDSIFNFIKKLEKSRRFHPRLNMVLRALLLQKLQSEVTFEEFKNILLILVCKRSKLNSRKTNFVRRITQYLEEKIPQICRAVNYLVRRRRKKPRYFPITKKDKKSANIAKIREERHRALRLKRERIERQRLEALERENMREDDYDVTDFLAGLVMNDIEEDTDSNIYLDDDSFFEEVEEHP